MAQPDKPPSESKLSQELAELRRRLEESEARLEQTEPPPAEAP